MANVPSFRFSFRGNIRRNHPFGNHPFVNTKKAHWEIKGRFRKRVVLANIPSFRFSFRPGTSAKITLLETTLFRTTMAFWYPFCFGTLLESSSRVPPERDSKVTQKCDPESLLSEFKSLWGRSARGAFGSLLGQSFFSLVFLINQEKLENIKDFSNNPNP